MRKRSISVAVAGTVIALGALGGASGTAVGVMQERTAPLPVSAAPASVPAAPAPVAAPATLEMFMYSTPGASDDLVVS